MENPIGDLDPRIAMALSGEFSPPSDPLGRSHTAARLYMGSILNGEALGPGEETFTYHPLWAPAQVVVASGVRFLIQAHMAGIGPALVIRKPVSADYDYLEVGLGGERLGYQSPEEIAHAASRIAAIFGEYFDQFEGWTSEDEIWVPPTSEPTSGSAG